MSIGFSPVLTRILIDSVLMKLSLRNGSVFDALRHLTLIRQP